MRLGVQALASKFSLPNSARIEKDRPKNLRGHPRGILFILFILSAFFFPESSRPKSTPHP